MKFNSEQKIVLFYGNILSIDAAVVYLAADSDGEVFAYTSEPSLVEGECVCVWKGPYGYNTGVTVSFEPGESCKDTLTCCEGDGQEWMIDLKTKIAVEYALLEANAIKRQDALCNVIDSFPLGKRFLSQRWDAFRKHSGVENVASKEFLDALEVKSAMPIFIDAEKLAHPEGDSLIIRDYYGSELAIPEWVKFIAMGKDGRVRAYEAQPETVEGGGYDGTWSTRGRGYAFIIGWRSENVAEKEWRNSLREVQK